MGAGAHSPWDWLMRVAAAGGHLEVFKLAREHDCPLNEFVCYATLEFSACN